MKAALAQIAPTLGRIDSNLKLHLDEARRAARGGADLVVFPELSLTGYLLQDLTGECAQDPRDSAALRRLEAASRDVAIVAGFVERTPGLLHHNAAGCWLDGRAAHLHRKVYLPTYGMFDEGRYFAAGEVFRTFQAPWGRTGVLVCEDFWHLSSSYLLSQEGMELLIVISASPVKGLAADGHPASAEAWRQLGQVVARFLSCFVLYVNRSGVEDGWTYSGGSFAVDPTGTIIASAGLRPGSLMVTLDPPRLSKARATAPLLRDEKLDLVRRELERIAAARYGTTAG